MPKNLFRFNTTSPPSFAVMSYATMPRRPPPPPSSSLPQRYHPLYSPSANRQQQRRFTAAAAAAFGTRHESGEMGSSVGE